jgi:hypothetical protein
MRATRRPLTIFWFAVTVDVIALGFAWSAWKAADTNGFAILVAAPASAVCVAATLVAGRILTVVSRSTLVATKPRATSKEAARAA